MADYNGTYTNATEAFPGLDLPTVAELACGFAMTCTAIFAGGSPESLIKKTSVLTVMGTASISDRENPRQLEKPINNQVRYVE